MSDQDTKAQDNGGGLLSKLPIDRFSDELGGMVKAIGSKAVSSAEDRIGDLTDRLTDFTEGGGVRSRAVKEGAKAAATGDSPVMGALKGGAKGMVDKAKEAFTGGGGGGGGKGTKVTNIIEEIDIGLPLRVVYNQWTEFQEFPSYMKKVEAVEQIEDDKIKWKAQVWWSHRTWESTILEQVPDSRIVWRSSGQKGYADGAVTFHELAPELTRVLLVLEYHPQGLFERTGNIWRAVGRRTRLEFKHFRRHAMTETILHPDEVEGWRGEIRDGEVVKTHEEALEEEREQQEREEGYEGEEEYEGDEGPEDEYEEGEEEEEEEPEEEYEGAEDEYEEEEPEEGEEEYEDEGDEDEPEDAYDEEEYEDEGEEPEEYEDEGEEPEDAYDEEEPEEEYDEDEEPEEEPPPRASRRRSQTATRRR